MRCWTLYNYRHKKYQKLATELQKAGLKNIPNLKNISNVSEMLKLCNAHYLTDGLKGLCSIADNTIDFIWSHSVLEHIRKKDFSNTMQELHRILKNTGSASHNVDLMDHLEKSLNNLRFPEHIWENDIFADSGFYTNRLRCTESLDLMKQAGFEVLKHEKGRWEDIPIPRPKLYSDFKHLSDEELRIRTYNVLLKTA